MRNNRTLCLRLGDGLTVLLLLAGGLLSWLSAYEIPVERGSLLLACLVGAALTALLWSRPWGHWPALGLLAAGLLALWRIRERLEDGRSLPPDGAELLALPGVQLLLAGLLALALGWVVVRARCWYLAALLVVTPAVPAILAGTLPDWPAVLAAAAGWISMLLSALYSRRDPASLGLGQLIGLGGTALLLAVLAAALPMEGYRRPQWATDARGSLLSALSEGVAGALDWELPPALEGYLRLEGGGTALSGGTGGAAFAVSEEGSVDLRTAGPRRYAGRTVLEISGEGSGPLYLRGGGAGVYTGNSWEAVDGAEYLLREDQGGGWGEPVFYPAATWAEASCRSMTIRHVSPEGTAAYYPYHPQAIRPLSPDSARVQEPEDSLTREGVLYRPQNVEAYEVTYLPGGPTADGFAPLSRPAAGEEAAYREFVYERYLTVPPEAMEALAPLLGEVNGVLAPWPSQLPEQYQEAVALARRTAVVLGHAAEYDLSAPAMEPGEDFVAHFLEAGRGYCVHFATAGALLLRMQGIPTRYVSGYLADPAAGRLTAVLDSDAHAWVEIYLDGFGWYPVEMTPAGGNAPQTPDLLPPEQPEEGQPSSDTPENPEQPDTSAQEQGTPDGPEDPAPPEDRPESRSLGLRRLWRAGLALLPAAVLLGLFRLAEAIRRRSRRQPDANRAAVAAYCRGRRLGRWGCGEDPVLLDLARKAKFSQHTLTEAERELAWQRLEELFRQTRANLPRWKGLLLGLLRPLF